MTPGRPLIFMLPKPFFSAACTVSVFSTGPSGPLPSFSHMRMNRQ